MRVLVVEDEERIASFLRKGLIQEGYEVDVAETGEEALNRAQTVAYELVILDLMLPGIDGLEVCRRLRGIRYGARILMLTAREEVSSRVEGLDSGADDYLVKPFAFEELLARLRALLRRAGGSGETVLQAHDLSLDPRTHEVTRAGRALELTPKEYQLLEYFLRHPDRVLTRDRLLEQVWGLDFDGGSNVVDVTVRNLRRKVDEGFDPPLIHTVRGFGYKLKG